MLKIIIKLWLLFLGWSSENTNHQLLYKFVDESEVPVVLGPAKTCCSPHTGVISSN